MCDPSGGPCDDYYNAAAVASTTYQYARNHLRTAAQHALDHGMDLSDLARATGRSEDHLTALIREDTL